MSEITISASTNSTPKIFGVVNMTEDSFSDGGRYLDPDRAIAHGRALVMDGADVLDLGAASSNPDARAVPVAEEIHRLSPVVTAFQAQGFALSIDSFQPETQRWAMAKGVAYLNDIHGFSEKSFWPELASGTCGLVVMHAIQESWKAERRNIPPEAIWARIEDFFARRVEDLMAAGVARSRLILDPGMGFFLSSNAEASLQMLRDIPKLKQRFGLPVMIGVSRKSFLKAVVNRATNELGAASLAAELFAIFQGADIIRTHEAKPLKDALAIFAALRE